jgi:mRNA-degrading endonuclease RelE of RelBE toxin-antitoxin system
MELFYTKRFSRSYADAPLRVRKQCDKQLALLAQDLRHPSLRAKKYDEARNIWQGRVNAAWRFYFKIEGDAYYLLDVIPHPK